MTEHRASCQCGAVQVASSVDPDFALACNCVACQKKTGAPFGSGAFFKKADVQISGDAWKYTRNAVRAGVWKRGDRVKRLYKRVGETQSLVKIDQKRRLVGLLQGLFAPILVELSSVGEIHTV